MKTNGSYAIVFAEKQLVPNQMRYQTALRSEALFSTAWVFCSRLLHSYVNDLPEALNQIPRPRGSVN